MIDRLPSFARAPAMTLLVMVGFFVLGRPPERAISSITGEHAIAVESTSSNVDDEPLETQLVRAGPSLSVLVAPVKPRLRSGPRHESWRSDLRSAGLDPATPGSLRTAAEPTLPAHRLVVHAGRLAAPSTAPPTLPV